MCEKKKGILLLGAFILSLAILCQSELSAGGASKKKGPSKNAPAKVEKIGDTGLSRITLKPKAAERLDIQMAKVREGQAKLGDQSKDVAQAKRKTVPYAAIVYDVNGSAWVYVSPQPLVFQRERIVVDSIVRDTAFLIDGPPVGTEVVTVGVAELYGAEKGIGK